MYRHFSAVLSGNRIGLSQSVGHALRRLSTETEEIIIPKEIPRSPTDILKALSSTVQLNPAAPHYKYHDDPYLIPYSNLSKRSYALSQEAGRKAAQWVRQEHADLFQHKVAEPAIEAFIPKSDYNEESYVSEEVLRNSILNICVSDSITIYNLLKKKEIEISIETKQSLLELVCYYNSKESLTEEWIEERWYRQGMKSREKWKNVWNDGGFAEQLFQELKGNSKTVCAMINGLCSHGQLKKAWEFYDQANSKGLKLNTTTYNSLLAKTCYLKENHQMVLQSIQELLQEMVNKKIEPNLGTLNSVLESLSQISMHKGSKDYALSVLAEFKNLGIEPCLATFYHLIHLYYSNRGNLNELIPSILDYIENNKIEIKDLKDVWFFPKAMEVISQRLYNKHLAYRLNNLLQKDNNYNFIGDSYKESIYYRYYFLLICKTETPDTFMEIYDTLVPNIYVPESFVVDNILELVEVNGAWNLLPRLWSDIVLFEHDNKSSIFERVLSLASMNTDESLNEALSNVGWSMWERIEDISKRPVEWTGPLLSDLMLVLLAAGDLSKAHLVMDKLDRLHNKLIGEPKVSTLLKYIDFCIKENSPDAAIKCIRYSNSIGFIETEEMAKKIHNSLQLKQQQVDILVSIVGRDALKMKEISDVN